MTEAGQRILLRLSMDRPDTGAGLFGVCRFYAAAPNSVSPSPFVKKTNKELSPQFDKLLTILQIYNKIVINLDCPSVTNSFFPAKAKKMVQIIH